MVVDGGLVLEIADFFIGVVFSHISIIRLEGLLLCPFIALFSISFIRNHTIVFTEFDTFSNHFSIVLLS